MDRIGKYAVDAIAKVDVKDGKTADVNSVAYIGEASVFWDEPDAACHAKIRYSKKFSTEESAVEHAMQQVRTRLRDGELLR